MIPSFAGILLGGLYLASKYGGGTYWIPAALVATLTIMLIGGLITGRKMNQLTKKLAKSDGDFDVLSALTNNRSLVLSYGFRWGLALGIVFLMTAKPDLWLSFFALVVGCFAGLFIAFGVSKISPMSCGPWRHRSLQDAPTAPAR